MNNLGIPTPPFVEENTYGFRKRFEFISGLIERHSPGTVLDYGCGTGNNLTIPLAETYLKTTFVGVDADRSSIKAARTTNKLPNATFLLPQELENLSTFDMVVASEVLEHVDDPDGFLSFLRNRLREDGVMVVTLPNGYGPFECAQLVESLLTLSGILKTLRHFKRSLSGEQGKESGNLAPSRNDKKGVDTLAVSPHVNFFSFDEIVARFSAAGLRVLDCRPRTLLCGFGFDHVLCSHSLIEANSLVADYLPVQLCSGWMILLGKRASQDCRKYAPGTATRLRRLINRKRWGLA